MKVSVTRWILAVLCISLLPGLSADFSSFPTNPPSSKPNPAAGDKQVCSKNLREIYKAIEAYQAARKDLPNWLSDLVPEYLEDANVLVCPVCRRTGKAEVPPLADPKLPSSYLFEFCPVPLGSLAPNATNRTRREWKRRQMGIVGSIVPLVRCRHHTPALNLSFDGKVYESPGNWESGLSNRFNIDALSATNLFADERPPTPPRFPPRSAITPPGLLNLTKFYNAALGEPWMGKTNENLSVLPKGLQNFQGTQFDIRGLIQLAGKTTADKKFPAQAKAIPVRLKCKRLHFLHAAAQGTPAEEGKQIGSYFVHFTGNPARLEIPIVYGRDVLSWRPGPEEKPNDESPKPAWSAQPKVASTAGKMPARSPRLFLTSWTNLAPEAEVESIDFVSNVTGAAPFLVAVSAE